MKKIVVVEDEEALQKVMLEWLSEEGYEAIGITTGTEAVEKIPEAMPDLVLLDIILPGISGFEVMSKLKVDERTKNIPILVLSNLGDEEGRRRALAFGADNYLVKAEYDLGAMKKIIEQVLNRNDKSNEIS